MKRFSGWRKNGMRPVTEEHFAIRDTYAFGALMTAFQLISDVIGHFTTKEFVASDNS
jgi:uncharacterized membrane protein (DUF4010 family)